MPSTYTWNGGSGDWNNSGNWTPGGVPGTLDAAVIDTAVVVDFSSADGYEQLAALSMPSGGGVLTVEGVLDIGDAHLNLVSNFITTTGGTVEIDGGAIIAGQYVNVATGTIDVSQGGTYQWNGTGSSQLVSLGADVNDTFQFSTQFDGEISSFFAGDIISYSGNVNSIVINDGSANFYASNGATYTILFDSTIYNANTIYAVGNVLYSTITADTWTDGVGDWSNDQDWSAGVPTSNSALTIGAGGIVTLGAIATVFDLTLASGGTLTVGSAAALTLKYQSWIDVGATLDLQGTATFDKGVTIGGTVSDNGTLSLAGGDTTLESGAHLTVAKLKISGVSTTLDVAESTTFVGAITQSSGTTEIEDGDALTLSGKNDFYGSITGYGVLGIAGGSTTIHTGDTLSVANIVESGASTSLTFGTLSYAGALTESSGTLVLPGTLTLTGTNSLTGKITSTGELAIAGGATVIHTGAGLSVLKVLETGASTTLTFGRLSYAGALTQSSGTLALVGTLTVTGTNSFSGKITSTGELAVTGGNTTINTGASLSVLKLLESGASSSLTLGALSYSGALTQSSGTLVLPGILSLKGTNSLSGKITGAGELAVTGGNTTVNTGATLSVANLLESGASTTLTLGTLSYAGALTESSGTLALPGTLKLTGTASLTGTVSGAGELAITGGSTTIHSGTTLSVANVSESGVNTSLTFGTLSYAGALTQSSGNLLLPGTLTLTGTNSLTGTVSSSGELAIAAGSTTIHTGAILSVAKVLESGVNTTLTFGNVSYGGALTESSGTLALPGTLTLTGTDSLAGTVSGTGKLVIAGGHTTIQAGANLAVFGWSILGAATDVTLNESLTYIRPFSLAAGTLDLQGGTLTLTGADSFSGGTVKGSYILLTQGTAKTVSGLTIGGTVEWENTTTVNQSGQVTIGDGVGNTAFLDNTSTGVSDLLGNVGFSEGSSAASYIANAGLLEKTAGTGISAITPQITNTGTIKVTAGTLDLQGAVTGAGSAAIVGASTLEFDSTVAAGQTMTFSGSGGTLDLGSPQGFSGAIKGFDLGGASNDALDIATGWTFTGATEGATSTTLGFVDGAAQASLTLQGAYTGTFNHAAISGGTQITYTA